MSEDFWDYHVTRSGAVATVALTGEIDMSVSHDVSCALITELRRPQIGTVCVDLSGVLFLGSAGLQALVEARQFADDHGKGFMVTGAKGPPLQVLETTGLLTFLSNSDFVGHVDGGCIE
jgi:anti-anti-sigma factor